MRNTFIHTSMSLVWLSLLYYYSVVILFCSCNYKINVVVLLF